MLDISQYPLTTALIALNVLASLYAMFVDRSFFSQSIFHIGAIVKKKQYIRILTSAFLHKDIWHLALNTLTLFFIGPAVEITLGLVGYALVYFGSLVTSSLVPLFITRKDDMNYAALGASGAVSGVVLSFCVFWPFQTLYFFGIVPIPAIVLAVLFLGYSTYKMKSDSRIAHDAHLGGALGGLIITLILKTILF